MTTILKPARTPGTATGTTGMQDTSPYSALLAVPEIAGAFTAGTLGNNLQTMHHGVNAFLMITQGNNASALTRNLWDFPISSGVTEMIPSGAIATGVTTSPSTELLPSAALLQSDTTDVTAVV